MAGRGQDDDQRVDEMLDPLGEESLSGGVLLVGVEVLEHLVGRHVIGFEKRISICDKGLRVGSEGGGGNPNLGSD